MRRHIIQKGNIHRRDHLRALITDTLPADIPIIISNDGFYQNMRLMVSPSFNIDSKDFLERLLKPACQYTNPYRYNIMRSGGSPRRLSLIHPSGQIGVVEFYQNYSELICYYCRKSDASIRSPKKVGSLFFVRGSLSDRNVLKHSGIDTVNLETTVSNPASFFSYKGFDRAFKFFKSADYLRLEKRYAVMQLADISKCFNSIYTHTLFWAITDVKTAKRNVKSKAFSNEFDRLMQSINYNETNGICIGAEVSRIFAELILSEVDRRVVSALEKVNLRFKIHYEFRRYVDDFYIFAQDNKIAAQVLTHIGLKLNDFNLHINELKTRKVNRPFVTTKSRMIRDADRSLVEFFERFIEDDKSDIDHIRYSYPVRIINQQALLRTLLDSVKASCFDNDSGYNEISNYIIGALNTRVMALINGYPKGAMREDFSPENYVSAIALLLEAIYFFYNVDPTVSSSLRVAQSTMVAHNFFHEHLSERAPFIVEQIVRSTSQFIKDFSSVNADNNQDYIFLEVINLLLVLGEVSRNEVISRHVIVSLYEKTKTFGYFEIISFLYCINNADNDDYNKMRDELFDRACDLVRGRDRIRIEAHAAHLVLDILSCPFILNTKRADLFNNLRSDISLPRVNPTEAIEAIAFFEKHPWFVNWHKTNLLSMIRKKELSAVY